MGMTDLQFKNHIREILRWLEHIKKQEGDEKKNGLIEELEQDLKKSLED